MSGSTIEIAIQEVRHWLRKEWSFADVGRHWDETEDYDDVNEETYSYFRRFIDGYRLSADLIPDDAHILDFCARTGNGTLYYYQRNKVRSAVCADVSRGQGQICQERLAQAGLNEFIWVEVLDYTLPFADDEFDTVLCFETVEHFCQPDRLIVELVRVTRSGGIVVLTTPNVLWEPVHAFAAVTGLHHSEGPHRFIRYGRLRRFIRAAGLRIERAETTVLVPAGPEWLTRLGEKIEAKTQTWLMPLLGLRRVLICRKV